MCMEPFYTSKGSGGSGLGLSMVYGVVQRHRGFMEIDSAPGKGTAVRLIFDVSGDASLSEKGTPQELRTDLPPLRILCIDDDLVVRESLKETLEMDGHRIEAAENGAEGVAFFLKNWKPAGRSMWSLPIWECPKSTAGR